jgi:4-aminobutyrate aminotransferase-like enzyme
VVGPTTHYRPEFADDLPDHTRQLIERRDAVLGAPYRLFYRHPITPVSASGAIITDDQGRQYLDAYNNVAVVGHNHPRVVEAVSKALATLNTHTRYLHPAIVDYSEALLASFPDHLDRIVYTCTGSEANDLALRLAREVTGHRGVIVTDYAYHGVTGATADMSPSLVGRHMLPDHVQVLSSPANYSDWAAEIAAAIETLNQRGYGVSALVLDTIFASDGLWPAGVTPALDKGITQAVSAVREAGGLVVADEVQAGFGRVGTDMWGFMHRFTPDVVTLGKPMGNGYPVAGVIARKDLFDGFSASGRYFNTFGGTQAAMAAAHATWNVLHDEGLPGHASAMEQKIRHGLADLQRLQRVADIRGIGLYWAVDFVDPNGTPDEGFALECVNQMRERGLLIAASGPTNSSLKIRPPLAITTDQVHQLVGSLVDVVKELSNGNNRP